MEGNRLELHSMLNDVMEQCGEEPHLYFQPPESVKLVYPCFLYKLQTYNTRFADNDPYKIRVSYAVTYITRSPTSIVPQTLLKKHGISFDRYYVADNLHHYVYTYTSHVKENPNG